jgi:hypothetical protein
MTRHEAHERPRHGHQEVWMLLPWYANGTLDSLEHEAVEAHLSTCLACQAELEQCRDLSAAVQTAEDPVWSPAPGDASRVLTRLEAAEARGAQDRRWWARLRAQGASPLRVLQGTPRLVRWALVAQGAMILLLAGVLVWQEPSPPGPLYRTLSDGDDHTPQSQAYIQVVFADDITEKELRALLTSVGGTIVKGPSSEGVYTVELPLPGRPPDLVGPVLDAMREHGKVLFAEPTPTR